jgi:hypothetical protein
MKSNMSFKRLLAASLALTLLLWSLKLFTTEVSIWGQFRSGVILRSTPAMSNWEYVSPEEPLGGSKHVYLLGPGVDPQGKQLYLWLVACGYLCSTALSVLLICAGLWHPRRHRLKLPWSSSGVSLLLVLSIVSTASLWTLKLFTTEVLEGDPGPNVGEGEIGDRILGIIWRWRPSLENFERHDRFHSHNYLVRLTPGTPPCSTDVNEDRYRWLVGGAYLYSTVLTVGLLALWIWNRRRLKPAPATVFD